MTDKQIRDKIVGVLSASMISMKTELECIQFLDRCLAEMSWIPVVERLPEAERIAYQEKYNTDEPVEVLVMIEGATEPTALFYGGWGSFFDFVGDETIFYPVTRWRPLPAAPKEE